MLEIHRNERCEAASSRDCMGTGTRKEKSARQTGGWYVKLEKVWMRKSVNAVKLWQELTTFGSAYYDHAFGKSSRDHSCI